VTNGNGATAKMTEKSAFRINDAVKPYLDEIAERLWSGHATVMIGAGFSKNAKEIRGSNTCFPDWPHLGDIFCEKLQIADTDRPKNYLSIITLADEIQARFGRPALSQIIRTCIPDDDYEPSELHAKLIELPWTDVFTTNFDTLLERARPLVTSRKYDLVINKQDLACSEKPRIIKLHGSLPSADNLVITQEDYRRYPIDNAPFVNTVQQALLENTLCLIGFSGDDPNFLHWLGWIRDNLGIDKSLKMYLLGVFGNYESGKPLMEQRNIVTVDLGGCPGVNNDTCAALELFCNYMASKKEERSRLSWPLDQTTVKPHEAGIDKVTKLHEVLDEWRKSREAYPGWCILPQELRDYLLMISRPWFHFLSPNDDVPPPLDFAFNYELVWRLDKCLLPLPDSLAEHCQQLLEKYWPFDELLSPRTPEFNIGLQASEDIDWLELRKMWLYLSFALLRFYREEGLIEKWHSTSKMLDLLREYCSAEQHAALYYERALFYLFTLDAPMVRNQLCEWPTDDSLVFWEAKRAGLLAEIGHVDAAKQILEESLKNVRASLNLKPVTTDYTLVSQESYLMVLLNYVRNSRAFAATSAGSSEFEELDKLKRSFRDRWNALKLYKCDPLDELKSFETSLSQRAVKQREITEETGFDIGAVTRSGHFGNDEAALGYMFLRFCEDAGIPFRIPGCTIGKKSSKGAVSRISEYSPHWALATLIRTGDKEIVDELFNRDSLFKMDAETVDELADRYLGAITLCKSDIEQGDNFYRENFGNLLAQMIPEILSRLCSKCSDETRSRLIEFLLEVYRSDNKSKYRGIGNLTKRLLRSWDTQGRLQIIPTLLGFPVLSELNLLEQREYINPFLFTEYGDTKVNGEIELSELDSDKILELFECASSSVQAERGWALLSLITLYKLGIMDEEFVPKLTEVIWAQRDSTGFPANTDYYRFAFFECPIPQDVDLKKLFKDYVLEASWPIQANEAGSGVSFTGGDIRICTEILGARKYISWSEEEISILIDQLVAWWDADKSFLLREDDVPIMSISGEFRARFNNLIDIMAYVIGPNITRDLPSEILINVRRILTEIAEAGLRSLRARAGCVSALDDDLTKLIAKINASFNSNDRSVLWDSLEATRVLLIDQSLAMNTGELSTLFTELSQLIKWRRDVHMANSLQMVSVVLSLRPDLFRKYLETTSADALVDSALLTDLLNGASEISTAHKLEIRRASASLAYSMYTRDVEEGKRLPSAVKKWESICSSKEEFAEIRNQWGQ
jgi:hypothetical protein